MEVVPCKLLSFPSRTRAPTLTPANINPFFRLRASYFADASRVLSDPVLVAAIVANLSSISPISTAPAVGLVANSAGFNVTSSAALAFNFNSTSVADASSNATAVANSTLPSNTTLLSNATIPSNSTLLPLNGTQLTPLNSTVLGNIASTLPFDNSTAVLNSTATILNSTSILANATATVLSIKSVFSIFRALVLC